MFVLSCSANLCVKFLILKIIQGDIIIHVQYIGPYVHYRLFLSDLNNCWIFSAYLGILFETKFMETRPVAEDLFHADTQTEGL